MTNQKKVVGRTMVHSMYLENTPKGHDAVIASEILEYDDGTVEPNLRVFKEPKMTVWVTNQAHRDHTDKKEFEHVSKLDEYTVSYQHKDKELFKILNNFTPNYLTPKQRRSIMQSPYVYGGNISIEARIGMAYKKALEKGKRIPQSPTTGFLDIEMSLLPDTYGEIPLIVITAENKVFLACNKKFMVEPNPDGTMRPVTLAEIEKGALEIINPLIEQLLDEDEDFEDLKAKLPFDYTFFAGDTEVDMIKWIFKKIHECKTSFMGVWNIGFDIPKIMDTLEKYGINVSDIFSHPDMVAQGYGHTSYREDKRDVQHWTQKWHWLTNASYTQFVDSTSLYSYIRTVDGKEASYKLDDILKKFGLGGKLKIGQTEELEGLQEPDWHRAMLSRYFTNYALYAMWDGMSLQLLEWFNNDLTTMVQQCDVTPPRFYPNQTISATNVLYEDWLKEGQVLGTGTDVEAERDEELITLGGAVLTPQNLKARGIKLFQEWPNHHTNCFAWVSDVDFSALYPTISLSMNIGKQTKVCTMFLIKGDHVTTKYTPHEAVEIFCSYLITPNSNGLELGTEFFNLPDIKEMDELFREHIAA